MPSRAPLELPTELEDAAAAFGSRIRVAILQSIADEGEATRATLARRLGIGPSSVGKQLAVLEDLGVLTVDPPRAEPGNLMRRYRIDARRLKAILSVLAGLAT